MKPTSKSQTTIFHLPVEILFDIMKMAGCCSNTNHDIRLVCKHFYNVYCGFTSCGLRFDFDQIRHSDFASMMHSLRRPSTFVIANYKCTETSHLSEIVLRFAVHVRKLQFQNVENIKLIDFEDIIRVMINVEEATFNKLHIHGNSKSLAIKPILLPRLKKLTLVDCDAESVDVLCMESSLFEEFNFHVRTADVEDVFDFTHFFENHKTIKQIAISGKLHNPGAFINLQLSELRLHNYGNVLILRDVIAHQPKLKCLNLLFSQKCPYICWYDDKGHDEDGEENAETKIKDEVFTVICNLKELETLKIGIELLSPNGITKIASLMNLKEIVLNDYDYDSNTTRRGVQKCFENLIAISLPKLESFTCSLKNGQRNDEYSSFSNVDVKTMAANFPKLKYLKIEMSGNNCINVRDILKHFPYLETLILRMRSTFIGESILMHENIKHLKFDEIETHFLIEMMRLLPKLESLAIRNQVFSLDTLFLENVHAALPTSLKTLKLTFRSNRRKVRNVVILRDIIKKLQKCVVKLTGDFTTDKLKSYQDHRTHWFMSVRPLILTIIKTKCNCRKCHYS